ncbi:hypothetical protein [Paenibacillus oleatilyticus]|uniref:Uncharacterized protein n=1 Tax=Paenibacillus oleatilyticus TaxID=2594886 RepID=A0ABV4V5Y6_9BACL
MAPTSVASYFFAKENRLSDLTLRSLTDQCEAMIKKHLRTPAILWRTNVLLGKPKRPFV